VARRSPLGAGFGADAATIVCWQTMKAVPTDVRW
jgi:hypothetical protein